MTGKHTEAVRHIRTSAKDTYTTGIILGTGLGGLVNKIDIDFSIDYTDIPHFPVSTVEFHSGKLIFGKINGKKIVAMQGRFHYYEGYSHRDVTFPIPILKDLGVQNLIVSNACGALNPLFRTSDLMAITSHINLHPDTPLRGNNFPYSNVSGKCYSHKLISMVSDVALKNNIELHKGVYSSVPGPNLETRSEYRMLRKIGADVVGMSTIPEILVAQKLGIEALGLSIITDVGFPDTLKVAKLEHIIEAAAVAEPKLTLLTVKMVELL